MKSYHPISSAKRYLSLYDKVVRTRHNISRSHGVKKKIYTLLYKWYHYRYLKLGLLYNLDIGLGSLKGNIVIYHIAQGIVINENAVVGEDCMFHGNNCIGNDGINLANAPVIGNGVHLGVGASVIGNVTIADDVWIAAGSVGVSSFNEPGIVIGGIPAKKIK